MSHRYNKGISVIEVLIGAAILVTILLGIATAITQVVQARERMNNSLDALYLAESGYEYVRFLRDSSWSNIDSLTPDTSYYLSISTTTITTGGPEIIDGQFLRQFHVREVYRDGTNDTVVASTTPGAILDSESYEVWVEVVDSVHANKITRFTGILTNIFTE